MIDARMHGLGRAMRTIGYIGLALAGAVLLYLARLLPEVFTALWQVMSAWLLLGGLLCAAGQVARRWVGEYVGLPLAGTAMFGFALLQGNLSRWSLDSVPSIALLGAFGLFLLARWRDVLALYRAAMRGRP